MHFAAFAYVGRRDRGSTQRPEKIVESDCAECDEIGLCTMANWAVSPRRRRRRQPADQILALDEVANFYLVIGLSNGKKIIGVGALVRADLEPFSLNGESDDNF